MVLSKLRFALEPTTTFLAMKNHNCGTPYGLINGRTLRQFCKLRGLNHKQYAETKWVKVCPCCDKDLLQTKAGEPLPFLIDGVMRTAPELNNTSEALTTPLVLGCFLMSMDALNSARNLLPEVDSSTLEIEKLGYLLRASLTGNSKSNGLKKEVYKFSKEVCEWGRGGRVWGNLLGYHEELKLQNLLFKWLVSVVNGNDVSQAIAQGIEIKGLGVSFASKHLRMLDPARFPVLDSVISEGLGFALNPKGYQLFQSMLSTFRDKHAIKYTIAELEGAIFWLVRQNVRASSPVDISVNCGKR